MLRSSDALGRRLPPAVLELAHHCGASMDHLAADGVLLTQTGFMRADPARRWAPFRARQSVALDRIGFMWRAATGPLGCITITDALEETGPRLTVVALGCIPLARVAAYESLTKGELQRYLAELPLAPDAILRNSALHWEVLTPTTLRVSATFARVYAQVDLTIGADGLVASASANRPRLEGTRSVERPWEGRFDDYRVHLGRQLPFAAEASWGLDGKDIPYWRGTMTGWNLGQL